MFSKLSGTLIFFLICFRFTSAQEGSKNVVPDYSFGNLYLDSIMFLMGMGVDYHYSAVVNITGNQVSLETCYCTQRATSLTGLCLCPPPKVSFDSDNKDGGQLADRLLGVVKDALHALEDILGIKFPRAVFQLSLWKVTKCFFPVVPDLIIAGGSCAFWGNCKEKFKTLFKEKGKELLSEVFNCLTHAN